MGILRSVLDRRASWLKATNGKQVRYEKSTDLNFEPFIEMLMVLRLCRDPDWSEHLRRVERLQRIGLKLQKNRKKYPKENQKRVHA